MATAGSLDQQGRKQGHWIAYWPDGSVLFEGHFVDGELDQSRDWTEYNRDGSTRFAQSDGPHPIGHPLAD